MRGLGWASHANEAQRRTAATEPQVPGPGLRKPTPKKVATAHQGFVGFWSGALEVPSLLIGTIAVGAEAAKIFENFWVEDGRADFVDAHGPFAAIVLRQRSLQNGKSSSPTRTIIAQVGQWGSLADFFRGAMS